MRTFLVRSVGAVTGVISRLSPLQIFLSILSRWRPACKRALTEETRAALTELWVVGNFVTAILILLSGVSGLTPGVWRTLAVAYGLLRVAQLVCYQVYTQIYGGYPGVRHATLDYHVVSWRRSIFISLLLYFETLVWFAALYRLNCNAFGEYRLILANPLRALYFSATTMLTIGYGDLSPQAPVGYVLVISHGSIALVLTVLILSRIISYLPKPRSSDSAEFVEPSDDILPLLTSEEIDELRKKVADRRKP